MRDAELINTDRKPAEKSPEKASLPEVAASLEGGHPHEEAERYVMNLMAEKIGKPLEQIDSQVGYYEMGLTSSGLLDVVETISEKSAKPFLRLCCLNIRRQQSWQLS